MADYFFISASTVFLYMCVVFLLAIALKDNSIVDVFWGMGFVLLAMINVVFAHDELSAGKLLFNVLVTLWAVRLSIHLFIRNMGREEDFRYLNWRKTWKHFYLRSFFQIFMLQGFFMLIIALPVILFNNLDGNNSTLWQIIGMIVFIVGFIFEGLGDYQMVLFKQDPLNKGKIITTGLWRITRHPNYFGEVLIWWGLSLFVFQLPGGYWVFISPITITLLLRFVSGVPMLEEKYKGRQDWEAYCKKNSSFCSFYTFSIKEFRFEILPSHRISKRNYHDNIPIDSSKEHRCNRRIQ